MADLHQIGAIWREFELAAAKASPDHEQLIVAMKLLSQVIWLTAPAQVTPESALRLSGELSLSEGPALDATHPP